jgi:hypothetical protein
VCISCSLGLGGRGGMAARGTPMFSASSAIWRYAKAHRSSAGLQETLRPLSSISHSAGGPLLIPCCCCSGSSCGTPTTSCPAPSPLLLTASLAPALACSPANATCLSNEEMLMSDQLVQHIVTPEQPWLGKRTNYVQRAAPRRIINWPS